MEEGGRWEVLGFSVFCLLFCLLSLRGTCEMVEWRAFNRLECSLGKGIGLLFKFIASYVSALSVNELLTFRLSFLRGSRCVALRRSVNVSWINLPLVKTI